MIHDALGGKRVAIFQLTELGHELLQGFLMHFVRAPGCV